MRAFVFTDESLRRYAGQFVWLSIDTEKTGNAPFLTRYPVEAWPSFFIIDAATETVRVRWVGGATVPQLTKLLSDGRATRSGKNDSQGALARADRFYGEGKNGDAAKAYREALRQAPAGWPHYARAVESLLFALQKTRDVSQCAAIAAEAYPRLAQTPSAANVAASGLDCALAMKTEEPGRAERIAQMTRVCEDLTATTRPDIAADDMSSVFQSLVDERERAGDETGRRQAAERWAQFLEQVAARAKTPEARTAFDSHRLSAYLEVGAPERAIPMLEASERDFPDDYNPPARLAVAYTASKRYDEALAASDRALARAYGPRKILILSNRADTYSARGDAAAAKKTLQEALTFAQSLPPGQRSESQIASLSRKIAAAP